MVKRTEGREETPEIYCYVMVSCRPMAVCACVLDFESSVCPPAPVPICPIPIPTQLLEFDSRKKFPLDKRGQKSKKINKFWTKRRHAKADVRLLVTTRRGKEEKKSKSALKRY
jgi:hypothetical protein